MSYMVTKEGIEQGTVSLYSITFLMKQNYSRAECRGLVLRWKYAKGTYWGIVKKGENILFEKPYTDGPVINCIAIMHVDFAEFLNLSNDQMRVIR